MSRNILSSKQNNWQTIFFEYLLAEIISCEACAKKYFSVFVSALKSDASLINVFAKVFGKIVLETQTNSTDLRTKMSQMKGLQCKKTQMYKFLSVWFVCKQCFSRQFILRHDNKFIIHCLLAKQYFAPTDSHFTCTFQLPFSELPNSKFCFVQNEII